MRISKDRQAAKVRISKLVVAMLESQDELGASDNELHLAMCEIMNRRFNQTLIDEFPNQKE